MSFREHSLNMTMLKQDDAGSLPKYAFVSYYSDQVDVANKEESTARCNLLCAQVARSAKDHGCDAFWLDIDCQPYPEPKDTTPEELKRLTNEDVSDKTGRRGIKNNFQVTNK